MSTDWLIGSVELDEQEITINGSPVVIGAGTYYLRDATAGLSLIGVVESALASIVATATVRILGTRRIQIAADVALTLTIPADLQPLLGLVGSPTVGTTVTAAIASTLLWSPSWRGAPKDHPLGALGRREYDREQTSSPDGRTTYTTIHGFAELSGWSWSWVPKARIWTGTTSLGEPGEFARFFNDVLIRGHRFKIYVVTEGSGAAVTWPSTSLGPYKGRDLSSAWWSRSIEGADTWSPVEFAALVVDEIV